VAAPFNDGVVFAHHYYGFDGFTETAPDFAPTSDLPSVPVEPDDAHYGRRGLSLERVLSVPTSLPSLLDTYFALDEEHQARVRRACYWLVHSHEVRRLSGSAAFTSVVQAIEALLPDTRRGLGPTRAFQDFVQRYVPDIDHKARRMLYDIRSDIVHGGRLLLTDLSPSGFQGLTPENTRESQLFDIARTAAQLGLVAWLQHHESSEIP
jgi:hypothetical protein